MLKPAHGVETRANNITNVIGVNGCLLYTSQFEECLQTRSGGGAQFG
jgi:hypothetical protein